MSKVSLTTLQAVTTVPVETFPYRFTRRCQLFGRSRERTLKRPCVNEISEDCDDLEVNNWLVFKDLLYIRFLTHEHT